MKTLEECKKYLFNCIDGRDLQRLAVFIKEEDLPGLGINLKDENKGQWKNIEWTKENILIQLKKDVQFGFEKALNKRGISSCLMYEVVKFWNWVLGEGLENWDDENYPEYGLPLFKATALKYGFENPIGDDNGDEDEYSMMYGEE